MVYRLGVVVLIMGYVSMSLALPPCVCNRNLKPVCGSDGQTYNSECLLNCAATTNPDLRLESSGSCDTQPLCLCPANIDYVCGTDGQTYPNPCLLECEKAKKNVEVQYTGQCRQKREDDVSFPCACPANIDPVCGTDGHTYPNPCLLECEKAKKNVEVQYTGQCRQKREDDASFPCACPANIDPVCGTDGQTYPNPCLLECEKAKKNVEVQYTGQCRQKREDDASFVCACPANIDPVCGTDGYTYPNPCLLECEKSKKNVEVQYTGQCRQKRENDAESLCACPLDIDPVCGTDGHTYPNPCALECEKAKKNVEVQHTGQCRQKRESDGDSLCACPFDIDPVCGTDGHTYSNPCALECEKAKKNVEVQHTGQCRQKRENDADSLCACPFNVAPVCGTDDQTYPNKCLLECEQERKNVEIQYEGQCRTKRENIAASLPCACPAILDAVCGTDGQSYANECLLGCEKARKNVEVQYKGQCREKRDNDADFLCACPANIDPVCGSDGRTYPNRCLLDCERNIAVKHEGPCRTKREEIQVAALDLPKCECTPDSKPVCGNDGLTYHNPCLLNCAKAYNDNLHVEHEGECEIKRTKVVENVPSCTCARNLTPVCASNGVTYGNTCLMNCASADLTMLRDGPCELAYLK